MKTIEKISEGANYTAATVGKFDELEQHVYSHPTGIEIPGKVFIGKALQCSGTEVSFQTLPPSTGIEFLHTHQTNEELYLIIKGNGEYQVDNQRFPISEGSLIRVAPQGKRSWRNTGDKPMVIMCIQSLTGSLRQSGVADGVIVSEPVQW